MRIAYLNLVHKNPRLLRRAIERLSSCNSAFFIHVDQKADINAFSEIRSQNVFFSERRIPVYWAEFSNVDAILDLLRHGLRSSTDYEYFVLMQGADYPLHGAAYIEDFFGRHRGTEFMSLVKMPAPGYPLSKINTLRYTSDKPVRRFASRALAKLGRAQRDYRTYLGDLQPFAGDACWALSKAACEYVVRFADSHSEVTNYFRNTHVPEESYFHTILGNSRFHSNIQRSLLYRYWPTPGHHPEALTEEHINFFEKHAQLVINDQFGSGEALFARKFSDARLDLIDRLDTSIHEREERSHAQPE
jgi:hypothetical protein